MSKRTKPTPEIVANLPQAEGALAEMAAIDRQLALINGVLNEALDAAKARAQTEGAALLVRRGELEKSVSAFAKLNKAELFKDRKTLELNFGTITFLSSVRTVQQSGIRMQPNTTSAKPERTSDAEVPLNRSSGT